jgi:hypothetical protein
MITLDHHPAVEGETRQDGQCRVVIEHISRVDLRYMLGTLREGRNFKPRFDAEKLPRRHLEVGLGQSSDRLAPRLHGGTTIVH